MAVTEPPYEPQYLWPSTEIDRFVYLTVVKDTMHKLGLLYTMLEPKAYKKHLFIQVARYGILNDPQLGIIFNIGQKTSMRWRKQFGLPIHEIRRGTGCFERGALDLMHEIVRQRVAGQTPPKFMRIKLLSIESPALVGLLTGYSPRYLRVFKQEIEDANNLRMVNNARDSNRQRLAVNRPVHQRNQVSPRL